MLGGDECRKQNDEESRKRPFLKEPRKWKEQHGDACQFEEGKLNSEIRRKAQVRESLFEAMLVR
jgi:hypothetical protein